MANYKLKLNDTNIYSAMACWYGILLIIIAIVRKSIKYKIYFFLKENKSAKFTI